MSTTRGVLFVHSTPSALCPHVEWAAAGALGVPTRFEWTAQGAEPSSYRAELSWTGSVSTAAKLASALKGWQRIRFEVTEEPTSSSEGVRYSYTPRLGIFHAVTGIHGDIQVSEERLKTAISDAAVGATPLAEALDRLLGKAWDDELEPFRYAGEGAPVRWLHQVV